MANATIVIDFGSAAGLPGAHLSAEIDSRPGGLNNGKTAFLPGDTVWLLVYKSANVGIQSVESSAGSINAAGPILVSKTETLTFAKTQTATLSVPAQDLLACAWLGRSLGTPVLGADGMTVAADTQGLAMLSATYAALAWPYSLSSPSNLSGLANFPITVLVQGMAQ